MTRRLRYQVAATLDGFIAGPGGDYDWIVGDPAIDFKALYNEFDTAVMGRKTFVAGQEMGASGTMTGLDVIVFSSTLPPSEKKGLRITNDDPLKVVGDLKKTPGKDIWLFGGGELFRTLLDAGLVDTVEVAVMPVLLGSGVPLLPPGTSAKLELADQKTLPKSGITVLSYGVVRPRKKPSRIPIAYVTAALLTALVGMNVEPVASQAPAPPTRQALADDLVTANRILAHEGVVDGYGHVSVRDPANANRYLLARAGAPALVTSADIVEYDLDSNPVSGSGAGYQERFIHGEVYKVRPDVTAVVHCHCLDVIPFAAANVPLKPMYHMGYFIGEGVPVFDIRTAAGITDMLVSSPSLGQSLARVLGRRSAALMRGHGAVVVADSLHVVVAKAYYLNVNARLQLQAMQLRSNVAALDPDEAKKAVQTYERSWEFWKSRLPIRP
jgi:ribulose-5-phosphate 4-epimerase/fuculose-1-phosphate aldolase/dihydrofolate reductase